MLEDLRRQAWTCRKLQENKCYKCTPIRGHWFNYYRQCYCRPRGLQNCITTLGRVLSKTAYNFPSVYMLVTVLEISSSKFQHILRLGQKQTNKQNFVSMCKAEWSSRHRSLQTDFFFLTYINNCVEWGIQNLGRIQGILHRLKPFSILGRSSLLPTKCQQSAPLWKPILALYTTCILEKLWYRHQASRAKLRGLIYVTGLVWKTVIWGWTLSCG